MPWYESVSVHTLWGIWSANQPTNSEIRHPSKLLFGCLSQRTYNSTNSSYQYAIFFLTSARPTSIMSKQSKHKNCSAVGCTEQHSSLHRPPVSEDRRVGWIVCIFLRAMSQIQSRVLTTSMSDCFTSLGQYNTKAEMRL